MKNLILFISLFLPLQLQAQDVVLYPGLHSQIKVGRGQLHVEHKGIVSIQDQGSSIKVIGKKTGSTKIVSPLTTHYVHVLTQKNHKTYTKLRRWAEHKVGPQISIESGVPYIAGKILLYEDWLELKEFLDEKDDYSNQAQIDDKIKISIKTELTRLLELHQLPFSDLVTEDTWRMTLSKKQDADLASYKKVLRPFGINVSSSQFAVSTIPMVEISIIAAEVNKRDMLNVGVSWPDNTVIQPFADEILNRNNWGLTLQHLEENGWGKVLASPTLVTQSGEEATFHSGGEIPIRVATQFNTNVQWKKYGIMMKIKPLVDFKGKIDVLIECEVSMIDGSTEVDGAPGLLINKITSHFNLQEKRTIALSGLIKEEWSKGGRGLPGLKDIPILGHLFKSQSYRNNRSELVFFVTPKIIK